MIDISGAWLSELGKLIYIITQLDDRFLWRVVHPNGVTETGIGLILDNPDEQTEPVAVHAKWNFHGGIPNAGVRSTSGKVIRIGNAANKIEWDDYDHFSRVS